MHKMISISSLWKDFLFAQGQNVNHSAFTWNLITFQPLENTDSDKMEAIPIIGGAIAAVVVLTIVIVSIIVNKR